MLDKGKDLDWFHSAFIVILLVVTVIAFAAWLIWETTEKHPIVDLSLFKSRSFSLGTVALCLVYAVFFGNIVLMPLWLQSFVGYTATWAGLVSAPSGVTAVLTSLMVGRSPPMPVSWPSSRRSSCRGSPWGCSLSPCSP
jgi:DHA2 family multidrug resistance protein